MLSFVTFKIDEGKEYKLKLRTMDTIQLEKRLGENLMDMFMEIENGKLPKLSELLVILHASLQAFNHGISERDVYDLYDEYVQAGHTMFDLIPVVIDVFKTNGIIPA